MENPNFLKKFPGLGNAPEVMAAKKRTEMSTGEKVGGDFESLIQNYLDRLSGFMERLSNVPEGKAKRKATEKFKHVTLDNFITKYENIPESYWREKDEDRNMGPFFREINDQGLAGDWNRMSEAEKETYKREHAETLIENQKGSLEEWIDYFLEEGSADIPDYLKYWVFRSIMNLQEYEKSKDWTREDAKEKELGGSEEKNEKKEGQFPGRSKNSLKKYPDLHPEALRYVVDAIAGKYESKDHEFGHDIQEDERKMFKEYLERENFAKLYAWAMESFNPIPEHLLPIIEGEWIKYPKGSDLSEVVKKLKGKGTGLCIAGKGAAHWYLDTGDLHIFYSNDEEGNANFPRIAIHAKDGQIAEMRGIAYKQNLDPYITDVASAKCSEFQNGKEYEEKSEDMKKLTDIENKTKEKRSLSREDLVFLYEMNAPIKYFGMSKDPRIEQLQKERIAKEDAPIVFDCAPEAIAWNQNEINEKTKAYVGPLFEGIFQKGIENIYTSFPEGKIEQYDIEIGGKTKDQLEKDLKEKNIQVYDWAKDLMSSKDFVVSENKENANLVRLAVKDLGFPGGATTDEIYSKAEKFGLELCPAEVGPHLRLQSATKDWTLIAMKQITDRYGHPCVFDLGSDGDKLDLRYYGALPGKHWYDDNHFVFRLRKFET